MVRVTVCPPLRLPTPVIAKVRDAGCICTEPAAPPMPVRTALAAMAKDDELAVRAPVTTPFPAGVKTTPVVQLAPAGSVGEHVFWTRLNGEEVDRARPMAAELFVFVTVAVCDALA